MFGIDAYSFETLWPSLLGVIGIASAMVWAFWKVRKLMNEDAHHHGK
ncbi:hypothetical protein [Marinobacterium weihaiense]|uniref:Uncharacterized protein n=1 Tax=Marinobacterium weihaiense TaxID=2851016 RepID=A0ABS6M8M1_9GAMM|nr:hypothetical protein [Marinobacterium weihaiense]MBV0932622.1 hypothetical protein [Marinobacterium weihaiense]